VTEETIKVVKKKTQISFSDFFTPEDSGAYIPIDKTEASHPKTIAEARKQEERNEMDLKYGHETFEEREKRVASEYGRRHIGWPCDIAQDLPLDDRSFHIKTCPECKRLIEELEKKIHYKPSLDVEDEEDN